METHGEHADSDTLFALGAGSLGALLLGLALFPFRGLTPASNFTYAFVILVIVVAEYGGPWAALATALVSALSLDFFLTEPYRRLAIHDAHDIVAVVGLGACGLAAAAVRAHGKRRFAELESARRHRELLSLVLREMESGAAVDVRLKSVLDAACGALPLAAAAARDDGGTIIAMAGRADTVRSMPEVVEPGTLLPPGAGLVQVRGGALPLPAEGGRLALCAAGRRLGWLDFWGDGAPADLDARRMVTAVASALAAVLLQAGDLDPHRPARIPR